MKSTEIKPREDFQLCKGAGPVVGDGGGAKRTQYYGEKVGKKEEQPSAATTKGPAILSRHTGGKNRIFGLRLQLKEPKTKKQSTASQQKVCGVLGTQRGGTEIRGGVLKNCAGGVSQFKME